jgi:hypothetical protein
MVCTQCVHTVLFYLTLATSYAKVVAPATDKDIAQQLGHAHAVLENPFNLLALRKASHQTSPLS